MYRFAQGILVLVLAQSIAGCGASETASERGAVDTPTTAALAATTAQAATPDHSASGGAMTSPDQSVSSDPALPTGQAAPDPNSTTDDAATSGSVPGSPGDASETAQPDIAPLDSEAPVSWNTYTDPSYGFSLEYPDMYAPSAEQGQADASAKAIVYAVNFGANAPDAIDLPMFSVEVFTKQAGETLEQWLDANGPQGKRVPTTLAGRDGYHVMMEVEMAPNQFFYVADGDTIYRLSSIGAYGEEMVASFRLR